MVDLLDLMHPEPKPVWRSGITLSDNSFPRFEGDLQFLWNDYREARSGGKWFRFDKRDSIWVCLDPHNQYGINRFPDQPPVLDQFGRLVREAAQ